MISSGITKPQCVKMEHVGTGSLVTKKNSKACKMLDNLYANTWFKFNSVTEDPQLKSMLESLIQEWKTYWHKECVLFLLIPWAVFINEIEVCPFTLYSTETGIFPGIILCMGPANERQCYIVTTPIMYRLPLAGRTHKMIPVLLDWVLQSFMIY